MKTHIRFPADKSGRPSGGERYQEEKYRKGDYNERQQNVGSCKRKGSSWTCPQESRHPGSWHQRRQDQNSQNRHLRHAVGQTAGHEYVGEIVEVGPGVQGFKVGDIVSGEGHITCGKCRNCLEGHKENCKDAKGVGVNRDGCFAEYLVIPSSNVWPTNPNIPEEMYAIFDPFGNATHTALSYDMLGEDVLITGAGPIGIMAAAIAKFAGARHVVITDLNEYRLDLAKKLGATRTVNLTKEKISDVMAELGMKEGFDVGLEMSGAGSALNDMIENMKHGGKIALLGLQRPGTGVNWETIIWNGLNIRGIYGRKVWDTWYKMTTMLEAGLDISAIITHRLNIKDYKKGFDAMISGQSGKVILNWEDIDKLEPQSQDC